MRTISSFLLGFFISTTIWLGFTNEHVKKLIYKHDNVCVCSCNPCSKAFTCGPNGAIQFVANASLT